MIFLLDIYFLYILQKAEIFDFIPPCSLDLSNDKKTSRQQVIALRNGHDTEVLLQFEDRDIENEWHKVLVDHVSGWL